MPFAAGVITSEFHGCTEYRGSCKQQQQQSGNGARCQARASQEDATLLRQYTFAAFPRVVWGLSGASCKAIAVRVAHRAASMMRYASGAHHGCRPAASGSSAQTMAICACVSVGETAGCSEQRSSVPRRQVRSLRGRRCAAGHFGVGCGSSVVVRALHTCDVSGSAAPFAVASASVAARELMPCDCRSPPHTGGIVTSCVAAGGGHLAPWHLGPRWRTRQRATGRQHAESTRAAHRARRATPH